MRFLVALFAIVFSLSACAEKSSEEFIAGEHYIVLDKPVRTSDPSKIEVAEVFSYHCPHCYHFEPILHAWEKKQGDDVVVVQTHAIWNKQMEAMAKAFYTIHALKLEDKAHIGVFNAIHRDNKNFNSPEQWAEFISTYGVDKETVLKTYNSFGVASQVKQADARSRAYGITVTPQLVINGKYRVSDKLEGGQEKSLEVAEFLINKERVAK